MAENEMKMEKKGRISEREINQCSHTYKYLQSKQIFQICFCLFSHLYNTVQEHLMFKCTSDTQQTFAPTRGETVFDGIERAEQNPTAWRKAAINRNEMLLPGGGEGRRRERSHHSSLICRPDAWQTKSGETREDRERAECLIIHRRMPSRETLFCSNKTQNHNRHALAGWNENVGLRYF